MRDRCRAGLQDASVKMGPILLGALAKDSPLLNDVLGSDRLGILVGQAERELAFFADQVTSVETERYLTNF